MTATRDTPERDVPRRRRGAALEDAILVAAYAELTDVGYRAFSIESVAARAGTGKASIYRRWPTRQELVLDALVAELPCPRDLGLSPECEIPDTTTTAAALHLVAEAIVTTMTSHAGMAMRAVKFEAVADPQLAACVDERFGAPRRAALLGLLQRGVERGEVRPEAACQQIADVLPAVLVQRIVMQDEKPTPALVHEVISKVMIPLVEARD